MPRISDTLLETVLYLYPSKRDAEAGTQAGGSGFLLGVLAGESEPLRANESPHESGVTLDEIQEPGAPQKPGVHVYAVTNGHVIEGEAATLRMNTKQGIKVLETDPRDWFLHPHGDDVAVYPLGLWENFSGDSRVVGLHHLLSATLAEKLEVGIGDAVFTVGRFINHEGQQSNQPSARFGQISMMPKEPVEVPRENPTRTVMQESFLAETRTMGGYSGSPVFFWTPPYELQLRLVETSYRQEVWRETRQSSWLLGICWGHIADSWDTVAVDQRTGSRQPFDCLEVVANTGMMGVVPSWKLLEVLNVDALRKRREAAARNYFGRAKGRFA